MNPGDIISHFRIVSRLGGGGMGVVYDAVDEQLKRPVALKFLPHHLSTDEEANARFIQEARAASALNHPNVCTIYEIGRTSEGQLFIAMARYEGETLKKRISNGPIPIDEALGIVDQIAGGLTSAHAKGILHRDIKPANILITDEGRAVILDFGLAKLAGGADITTTGSMVGTAAYMSPEQIRGEQVDAGTDQWSLGIMTYEMLAGQRPFRGEYEQAVAYTILNEPINSFPPSVPAVTEAAIRRALSKDPEDRFESVKDYASALRGTAVDASTVGKANEPPRKKPTSIRHLLERTSLRAGLVAGAVVIALAAIVAYAVLVPSGGSPPTIRNAVAVLPFSVAGDDDLAYLSEGMADMISTVLDGVGRLRSIDPFVVLSAARKSQIDVSDPEAAHAIARKYGASEFMLGNILRIGDGLRISASLYDLDQNVVGRADHLMDEESGISDAIDQLIRKLFADRLEEEGRSWQSLAASATQSVDALRAFLDGDRLFRLGQFTEAADAYARAVESDSTFALAWYQWSRVAGFTDDWADAPRLDSIALVHAARLPERHRKLIEARNRRWRGETFEAEKIYTSIIESYPDEVHAWTDVAELRYHDAAVLGASQLWSRDAFGRALELDPDNAETLFHAIELAIRDGRESEARMLINLYPEDDQTRRKSFEYLLELSKADGDAIVEISRTAALESPSVFNRFRSYSSTVTGDLIPFETAVQARLQHGEIPASEQQILKLRLSTALLAGRGKLIAAERHLTEASDRSLHDRIILNRVARAVTPPYSSVQYDDLEELRTTILTDWPHDADYLSTWRGLDSLASDYLAALLSLRMNDEAGWDAHSRRVAAAAQVAGPGSHADGLVKSLNAVYAWRNGRHEGALAAIEGIRMPFVPGEEFNWLKGRHLIKIIRAESMRRTGNIEDAAELYSRLGELDTYSIVPALYWEAECREDLGDYARAAELYDRFARLWADADEPLRNMVTRACQRAERLLASEASESPVTL